MLLPSTIYRLLPEGCYDTIELFARLTNAVVEVLTMAENLVIRYIEMRKLLPSHHQMHRLRSDEMRLLILERRKLFRAPRCHTISVKL